MCRFYFRTLAVNLISVTYLANLKKNATPSLPETGYGGEIQIEESSYRSRSHLLLATTFEEKMGKIDRFIDPRPY